MKVFLSFPFLVIHRQDIQHTELRKLKMHVADERAHDRLSLWSENALIIDSHKTHSTRAMWTGSE